MSLPEPGGFDLWPVVGGPREQIKFVFEVLKKSAPLYQIIIAAVALVTGLWFGNRWRETEANLSRILISTLGTKTEIVAQPYSGLETYLLSTFGPTKQSVPIPTNVQNNIDDLETILNSKARSAIGAQRLLVVPTTASAHDQYVTLTDDRSAFLFVPGLLIGHKLASGVSRKDVETLIRSSSPLGHDIEVTSEMSQLLESFDGERVDNQAIVQSYIMTETGVLLIRKTGIDKQASYYGGMLPAHRFFPERAYFWPTVESTGNGGNFDSVSEAYIDSGGNGPARTFCKRLSRDPAYVLCLDASLIDQEIHPSLAEQIEFLGGTPYPVRCSISGSDQGDCNFTGPTPPDRDKTSLQWLTTEIIEAKRQRELALVFGRVATPDCIPSCDPQNIEFTIPTDMHIDNGERYVDLYWAHIDLRQIQQGITVDATAAVAGFVTCILLIVFLGNDYHLKIRQQRAVLKNVSRVMKTANTPFAWTDEQNRFVDANDKFVEMLEYDNFKDLNIDSDGKRRTFRDLLESKSKDDYDRVLLTSMQRKPTDPYEVRMVTKKKHILSVRIHGESVPFPGLTFRGLPHRFGVILECSMLPSGATPEEAH